MAQWKGLGSARNHATKVADVDASLRVAVSKRKAKAVRNLARRLLSARLHLIGSQLVKAKEKQADSEAASLQARYTACEAGGIESILEEFGFDDVAA
jgi:hypothetical protein